MERDLSERDYVYAWVDCINTNVRLGRDDRLCSLVMVGGSGSKASANLPLEHRLA